MSETETDETTGRAPPVDTTMDAWVGREADDVPPGWMDNVVKRLLKQMNRQLVLAEEAEDDKKNDARTRDMNSRSLVRLELMLERLIQFETQRAKTRTTTKADAANAGDLEELKRRIDRIAATRGTAQVSGEPEC